MTFPMSDALSNPMSTPMQLTGRRRARGWAVLFATAFAAVVFGLAGCGPVQLVATSRIPTPLIVKLPVTVALFMPQQFAQYVHKEERWGTDWNIDIGKAQTDALSQLVNAMFDKVIVVDSLAAGGALGASVSAILEPSVEEYAFVTPRDAGSPFFAVSIKYRVNVYMPDGKLADSWGFTGYGTSPAGGLSNTEPLQNATALAMRDAGAKLVVEFRDQPVVRGLFPEAQSADDPPAAPSTPSVAPAPSNDGASGAPPVPVPESDPANQSTPPQPGATGAIEPTPTPKPSSEPPPEPSSAPERERETPEQDKPEEESEPPTTPEVEAFALSMLLSS